jgi:hypothetical protein
VSLRECWDRGGPIGGRGGSKRGGGLGRGFLLVVAEGGEGLESEE